jgi:hypothetical protein
VCGGSPPPEAIERAAGAPGEIGLAKECEASYPRGSRHWRPNGSNRVDKDPDEISVEGGGSPTIIGQNQRQSSAGSPAIEWSPPATRNASSPSLPSGE